jgi:signal transduction histidine kinase
MREQEQRRNAYVQAIYETGSRLTHDVKNLLQTLRSLCAAAETSDESDSEALRLLMQRQLPQITQRLQITLDKLNTKPPVGNDTTPALQWWEAVKQRYAHVSIEFEGGGFAAGAALPADLFETAAENLLQNALEKRKVENKLHITARLQWDNGFHLSVCDDGQAVPVALVRELFATPVQSNTGLGVGLYQVARFASDQGYKITLTSNVEGKVCITLAPSEDRVGAA